MATGRPWIIACRFEQFMMIEDLHKTTDKLTHIENMALNKVNIEFLRTQMDKVLADIEKLKRR